MLGGWGCLRRLRRAPQASPCCRREKTGFRLVMGEIAYLFNCRYLLAPVRGWQDFSGNPYVLLSIGVLVVIQAAFTYLPFMQKCSAWSPSTRQSGA